MRFSKRFLIEAKTRAGGLGFYIRRNPKASAAGHKKRAKTGVSALMLFRSSGANPRSV